MREILSEVEEGGAEWLATYSALQGDLTESQRAALVAQQADLQNAHGEVLSVYTGDAEAAEEAQARMDEANKSIAASYRAAALDIALTKIAEQYEGDALAAQEAFLALQVAMGTIGQAEADKLLEIAENTALIQETTSTMLDEYLEDGVLAQTEIENLAGAVDLIEDSATRSKDAIILAAERGVESFAELDSSAQFTSQEFITAQDEAEELMNRMTALDGFVATVTIRTINETTGGGGTGGTSNGTGGGGGTSTNSGGTSTNGGNGTSDNGDVGTTDTFNNNITIGDIHVNGGDTSKETVDNIMTELGRRLRQASTSGAGIMGRAT
jgi:hypothetical protein